MSDQAEQKKGGGFVKGLIIFLVIIILLVGGFVALLKFDVAGLGTEIIGPQIKDIPGASLILPEMPEEEVAEGEEAAVTYESLEQAVEILKVTENSLKEKEEEAEKLNEQITELQAEIERLQEFEVNYLAFEAERAAFDQAIVDGTDASAFSTWYETMYPDNAASIYADVIGELADDADLKHIVEVYSEMKPAEAAKRLEEIGTTRLDDVATIIRNLEEDEAAKILDVMDETLSARITVYILPEE